ncbi:MAG: S-layer homology domain-containing protein [Clostridiales bacterium]|nr:S-layer homology domain-containing protein [Clostridiales bacterium]
MKKIISIICALMLLMQCVPSLAAQASSKGKEALLEKLEIMPSGKKADDTISRLEFAMSISRMLDMSGNEQAPSETYYIDVPYTDERAAAINLVTANGIMNGTGGGRFEPDTKITVMQAVAAVINLLGYSVYAKTLGSYPDAYSAVASELKLTNGVGQSLDAELSYDGMKKLLSNALDTDMMLITSLGVNPKYEVVPGNTLLLKKMKIKTIKGVVKGSYKSALTKYSFAGLNEVNIDGVTYNIGSFDVNDLVGCYVTAYFTDNDDEELIFIEKNEQKTKELIIDAEDFISYSDNKIEYYDSEREKSVNVKIETDADVLFEDAPVSVYDEDIFKISDGSIKLIDNDGDGIYNVITVKPIYTIVVKAINYEKKNIVDYFSDESCLDINNVEDKNITVTDENGRIIKFTDITQDSVITWSKDSTGTYYNFIVMQDAAQEGTVSGISRGDTPYVTVNDTDYKIAPSFEADYDTVMKVGDTGILYIDSLGRAVGFRADKGKLKTWSFGYLLRTYKDESGDDRYFLKMLNENGEIEKIPVVEKFSIDFVDVRQEDRESAIADLSEQVIRYCTNSDGEITKIDTEGNDTVENSLVKKYESTSIAYKGLGLNSFLNMAAVDSRTIVFVTPLGGGSDSDYSKRDSSYFQNDTSYNIEAYGKKDAIVSDVIVVKRANTIDASNVEHGVVEEVSRGLNDGEVMSMITLYSFSGSKAQEEKLFVSNSVGVSNIMPGQVIEYSKNIKDEIISIKTLYDYRNNIKSGFTNIGENMSLSPRAVFGKIARFEDGQMLVVDDEAADVKSAVGEIFNYNIFQNQGRVFVYDTDKRKDQMSKATDGDIYDYASVGESCSRAVVLTSMCWPVAIIVYN